MYYIYSTSQTVNVACKTVYNRIHQKTRKPPVLFVLLLVSGGDKKNVGSTDGESVLCESLGVLNNAAKQTNKTLRGCA